MKWHRVTAATLGCISVLVLPGIGWADPQDRPVAGCPQGASSVSMSPRTLGAYGVGPFGIFVGKRGIRVEADGRVLRSSVAGAPFVGAARGAAQFTGSGGF